MPRGLTYKNPVLPNGRFAPWVNDLRNRSGAYVIRERASGRHLYVGESHTGRLAQTIKRHFYDWRDDPERRHLTYARGRIEIAVRLTPPGPAATGAQNNLLLRLEPRDNHTNPKANDETPF